MDGDKSAELWPALPARSSLSCHRKPASSNHHRHAMCVWGERPDVLPGCGMNEVSSGALGVLRKCLHAHGARDGPPSPPPPPTHTQRLGPLLPSRDGTSKTARETKMKCCPSTGGSEEALGVKQQQRHVASFCQYAVPGLAWAELARCPSPPLSTGPRQPAPRRPDHHSGQRPPPLLHVYGANRKVATPLAFPLPRLPLPHPHTHTPTPEPPRATC